MLSKRATCRPRWARLSIVDISLKSNASCVALLRAAGGLILGKTVTCEFAGVTAGETTNPHDPTRTPGGSSSGSAAAVADFMVPLAIGTQTGGSVQRPSSYCGIVGYKPTFGLINPQGVRPAAVSLDTVGLMARTVEDVELSMRVLTNSARDYLATAKHDDPHRIMPHLCLGHGGERHAACSGRRRAKAVKCRIPRERNQSCRPNVKICWSPERSSTISSGHAAWLTNGKCTVNKSATG